MYCKIILLACLLMFANAHKKHQKRIHGGLKAKLGEFPYQVSVHVKLLQYWHSVCSGALIKPNYVLTGAECVIDGYAMRVRAGYVDRSSSQGQYLDVASKIKHPDYNATSTANDIALLKLNDSFPICNTISVVNLPSPNSPPTGEGTLAGWGVTESGGDQIPSNDLYYANFTVISNTECQSELGPTHQLQDSNVCAKSPSALACSGDEGGSLVQNNVTIAVKSWLEPQCGNEPGVYTKVYPYIEWINDVINQ